MKKKSLHSAPSELQAKEHSHNSLAGWVGCAGWVGWFTKEERLINGMAISYINMDIFYVPDDQAQENSEWSR